MAFMPGLAPTPGVPNPAITGSTNWADVQQRYSGGTTGGLPSAGLPAGGIPMVPDEPSVFLGLTSPPGDENKITRYSMRSWQQLVSAREATLSEAIQKFDRMSFTEQRNMLRLLAIGGFAGAINLEDIDEAVKEASQLDARDAYMALLEQASDYYMQTGAQVTPNDVLRSAIAYRLDGMGINWDGKFSTFDDGIPKSFLQAAEDALGLGEEEAKPYTEVTRQKSVDLMSPQDAKGLTRAMLQQELGRDPTQAEYEDFISALHAAERQNPVISTTTSHYGVNEVGNNYLQSSNTVTRGGLGEAGVQQVLTEQAQANPNWAEWQAVGTYFPALLNALGATVPGA